MDFIIVVLCVLAVAQADVIVVS